MVFIAEVGNADTCSLHSPVLLRTPPRCFLCYLVLSLFTQAHTKPLSVNSQKLYFCRPVSCWHDHRAAQALTKQPKATAAVGMLRLHAHGWRGRNSISRTNQSLKQTQTQKKGIKLLLTAWGFYSTFFLRNLILLLRAPLGEQPG